MTTVIIIVAVLVVLALVVLALLPRLRAKKTEQQLESRRGEVAQAHRSEADDRKVRAEYAEQQAQRERAEADLHESRAKLHERGMADDDLDADSQRLAPGERGVRDPKR